MIRYGDTPENMALIFEKAKAKKDGVYTIRGVAYRVQDGRVTHIACNKKVLELCGNFNVAIGSCDIYSYSQIQALKKLRGGK